MWGQNCFGLRRAAAKHPILPTKHPDPLTDLRNLISAVDCPLKHSAAQLVFADGKPSAQLMIIGEAPGREEDEQGVPFVGRSGKLLEQMLHGIGLQRAQTYITNMIPWRPPGNRAPTEQEIATFLPYVHKHIAIVSPRVLLLLGATATRTLYNDTKTPMHALVGRWRRFDHGCNSVRIIATYHPAYLMRVPTAKREAWRAMVMIGESLRVK
jgi:DNA polymerase